MSKMKKFQGKFWYRRITTKSFISIIITILPITFNIIKNKNSKESKKDTLKIFNKNDKIIYIIIHNNK